jgi:hypothetical protein
VSDGYSYTTISTHDGGPTRINVSLHLDERAHMAAYLHEGGGSAHLTVEMGHVSATVGPARPATITAEDARIARRFADQAAEYAALVERIAAAAEGGPAAA